MLNDNFSDTQVIRKRVVPTAQGVVASAHKRASEAGAAVLAAGGDAIDAAVATSFAIGVVEPWMSGLAGGGAMVIWRAKEKKGYVVDYGMHAPRALDPADYPITGKAADTDLFAWPTVKDNRNVEGATAVAVPGVVSGMALAHGRFGRLPWRDVVMPAVGLAREGMRLDWFGGLMIAASARVLSKDPDAAALFLEDGRWPPLGTWTATTEKRLNQSRLAQSLQAIADQGAKALYGGELGAALAADIRAKGGSLSLEDLASYQARLVDPLDIPRPGGRILAAPGLTGGPALAHAVQLLAGTARPKAVDYARALHEAWTSRLQSSGDKDSCTTHFSVVDREGNMCAVTQTLLSVFGSRVVSGSTGIPLNNGIMWFDPEPGKPNSLAPGKRCLGNYCPVVGEDAAGRRFALGASGGRKIMGTVLQIASFLIDHGQSLEAAFHAPKIDMSGNPTVIADAALPDEELSALRSAFPTETARRLCFPYSFAVPAAVLRDGEHNMGCTEIMNPWGDAVSG